MERSDASFGKQGSNSMLSGRVDHLSGTLGDRPGTLKFVQGAAYVLPCTPAGSDGPPLFSPPWRRSMTPISRRSWLTLTACACACASVADALSADAFAAEEIPPGYTSPFQVPESGKAPGMRVRQTALSRQMSIGYFRAQNLPRAVTIHEQKQWSSTVSRRANRQYRI
jgi:hypothetical protein